MLAVLGAATEEGLTVKDAGELRIKETDRIRTVVDNLRRLGVEAEELPDGMVIPGRQKFRAAEFDSFGDHRIAMAFAVAALRADGPSVIEDADAASVSFPEFWSTLARIAPLSWTRPPACANAASSRISASSAMVFWILRRINSAISSTRATALRIQANCTLAASASSSRRMS